MKVLITGATGFLGKYIVEELLENNYEVIAFGRNEKAGEKLQKIGAVFLKGDLTNKGDLYSASAGVDAVVHAGALSSVWGKWQDFYETNVLGTENVLEVCCERNIKKLVFISSPSIYASAKDQLNICEDEAPEKNELNFYIKSKIMAERKVKEYSEISSVILRPRGLFGVGDTSIIPRLLHLNKTIGIPLFSEGKQKVDITCVENVALAVRLSLEKENTSGKVYNITNDEPMEFRDIIEMFFKEIGDKPKFIKLNYSFIKILVCCIEKIYKNFNLSKEPPLTEYSLYLLKYSQTLSIEKAKRELEYKTKMTALEGVKKYAKSNRSS